MTKEMESESRRAFLSFEDEKGNTKLEFKGSILHKEIPYQGES